MVFHNIEDLLEKYNNAETSLKEEAQLQAYFTSDDVAPHLEHYKPLFTYFLQTQQEQYTKDVPLKPRYKTQLYKWISVAAVAILMLGLVFSNIKSNPPESQVVYTEEEIQMYNETKAALAMMFGKFNKGTQSLNTLNVASENFNYGINKANHITQLNTTTNKLLKN